MNVRILCISDIHGQYDAFCRLLDKAAYDPDSDRLILLGDFIDGGPCGRQVVDKAIELTRLGAIAIRGNHEEAFLAWLRGDLPEYIEDYKAVPTLRDYIGNKFENRGEKNVRKKIKESYTHHVKWMENLPYFYETADHIFVHAGINPTKSHWRDTSTRHFVSIRKKFFLHPTGLRQTVVFGHTPGFKLYGGDDIWFGGDKIGIDGGAGHNRQLNCLVIIEDGYKAYSCRITGK
jgi:serine/threonine protein phosphatase 1